MSKQFIVKLSTADGTVVANTQVITYNTFLVGNILANDFIDNTLTGTITTNQQGQATFTKTITGPTFTIVPANFTANEGDVVTFTITTTNVSTGTNLYWLLDGLGPIDYVVGSPGSYQFLSNATVEQTQSLTTGVRGGEYAEIVNRIYLRHLGRYPESSVPVDFWVSELLGGTVTVEQFSANLASSPEAQNLSALPNGVVSVLANGNAIISGTVLHDQRFEPKEFANLVIKIGSFSGTEVVRTGFNIKNTESGTMVGYGIPVGPVESNTYPISVFILGEQFINTNVQLRITGTVDGTGPNATPITDVSLDGMSAVNIHVHTGNGILFTTNLIVSSDAVNDPDELFLLRVFTEEGAGPITSTANIRIIDRPAVALMANIIAVGSPRSYHSNGYRGAVYTSTDSGATWYKSRTNSSGTFTSEAFTVQDYLTTLVGAGTNTINAFTTRTADRDGDSFADGIDRAMWKSTSPPTDFPGNLDKTQWTNVVVPFLANASYLDTSVLSSKYDPGTNKVYSMLSNGYFFRTNPDGSGFEQGTVTSGTSKDFAYNSDLSVGISCWIIWNSETFSGFFTVFSSNGGWGNAWVGPGTAFVHSGNSVDPRDNVSVTYGAGRFVSVLGKQLIYSPIPFQSTGWLAGTLTDGSTSNYFRSVCFGQNKFVAVGSTREYGTGPNYPGSIYTSTDGVTWNPAANRGHTITAVLRNVHYSTSANIFIAVGDDGPNNVSGVIDPETGLSLVNTNIVLTSPDGNTWTQRTLPNTQDSLSLVASTSFQTGIIFL